MLRYLWANILGAFLFAGINIAVFVLKKDKYKVVRGIALLVVCIVLISYKAVEYTYFQIIGMNYKVPLEFSQVAYFLFPISVFVSKKTKALLPIGAFSAILAGLFFNLGWIASAKTFFERDTVYQLITATVFHNALYFGGMVALTTIRMPIKNFWHLPVGVGAITGWHYLMHYIVDNEKDIILKSICEAKILDFVFPAISNKVWFISLYYTVVFVLVAGLMALFYAANQRFTKQPLQPLHID